MRFRVAIIEPFVLRAVVAALVLFAALGAAEAKDAPIIIVWDLDGVIATKLVSDQASPIVSDRLVSIASTGGRYVFSRSAVELIQTLASHPHVIQVVYSKGDRLRNEELLKAIPAHSLTEGRRPLKDYFKVVLSRQDLAPVDSVNEATKPLIFRASALEKKEDRGYKDLRQVLRALALDGSLLERTFLISDNGSDVYPGQEKQWVRTPKLNAEEPGGVNDNMAIALSQIYARRFRDGTKAWDLLGPVDWNGVGFRPGSVAPQASFTTGPDYFLGLPTGEYEGTRLVGLDVDRRFPAQKYHRLILGRSPIGIGIFLEALAPGSVSYLAFSGGHMPGRTVRSWQNDPHDKRASLYYPPLTAEQEQKVFDYFLRALPSPEELGGKKIVVLDYHVRDAEEGLESFFAYLQLFKQEMRKRGQAYEAEVEGFALFEGTRSRTEFSLSGVPVTAPDYGHRASDLLNAMYRSDYEKFAPYGRFNPQLDEPPQPGESRIGFRLLSASLRGQISHDAELSALVRQLPAARQTAVQEGLRMLQGETREVDGFLIDLIKSRPHLYLPYFIDQIVGMSRDERRDFLRDLLQSNQYTERVCNVLLDFIVLHLPEREQGEWARAVMESLLTGHIGWKSQVRMLELFPEHFSQPEILGKVVRDAEDMRVVEGAAKLAMKLVRDSDSFRRISEVLIERFEKERGKEFVLEMPADAWIKRLHDGRASYSPRSLRCQLPFI